MNTLPPLGLMRQWREQGLTPQEVYQKCETYYEQVIKPQGVADEVPGAVARTKWPVEARGQRYEPAIIKSGKRKHNHDAEKFYEMYQTLSLKEVGEAVFLSTERVRQILREAGYTTRLHVGNNNRRGKVIPLDKMIALREAGLTCEAIGKKVNLSASTVQKYLRRAGVNRGAIHLTPIGCPDCETEPVARGLCNKCYVKWHRRGKPEDEAVRPKVLLPIDCEDCKTRPFCKGFCRPCYHRQKYREQRAA